MVDDFSRMKERVEQIRARIESAALLAGRVASDVKLAAVTKNHDALALLRAENACVDAIGENRVQEAARKRDELAQNPDFVPGRTPWLMIGHLQRNKVKKALELFDRLDSVDSLELALMIDDAVSKMPPRMTGEKRSYPILIEVNVSREVSKNGVSPEVLFPLVEAVRNRCSCLEIEGFMTIAPLTEDAAKRRAAFALLRELAERARGEFALPFQELSMGMSDDFEEAIAEGSTLVRIGTALMGPRMVP